MVTLTLKKKPGPANEQAPAGTRSPLRSTGLRKRPTLAEAQARRAEHEAEEQQRPPRPGNAYPDRRPDDRYRSEPVRQGERREGRDPRDQRDPRDARDPRAPRDYQGPRDARDPRDTRDHRDNRPPQQGRDRWQGDRPPARPPYEQRPPRQDDRRPPSSGPRSVVNAAAARQISPGMTPNPRPRPDNHRPAAPYGGGTGHDMGARNDRRPPQDAQRGHAPRPQDRFQDRFQDRPQDRFQERPQFQQQRPQERQQDRPPQRSAQQPYEAPRPRGPGPRSVINPVVARQLAQASRAENERQRPQPVNVPAVDGERLSKRMTALGLASRREADEWIEAGWVRVNGKMAVLGQRVHQNDQIHVDPAAHRQQAQRMTILLNKPIGYVSGQAEDGYEPASVLIRPENQWKEDQSGHQWHPGHLRGLAPAGRLDIDSVGMLVLTQDGRVAKQLIGDDSLVEKEYLVRVEYCRPGEQLPDADLALLNHGLSLDGKELRPCKVSWANEDQLRFVLREGKKRQIRRMCETVGLKVIGLKRVRIGSVPLGHLPVGQWRYLRRDEYFA